MLYERWKQISTAHRNEPAVRETPSGKPGTFGELFAAGERAKAGGVETIFPAGHSPEFILQLLAAWLENKVVCPLEPGQPTPETSTAPKDCVNLKWTWATSGSPRLVAFTGA